MSQFQKLLADLEQAQAGTESLAKSIPAGGDGAGAGTGEGGEGAAAAATGAGGAAAGDGAAAAAAAGAGNAGAAGGEPLVKSIKVKLEDGTEVDAEDGTELVKALIARQGDTEATLQKAVTIMMDVVGKQNTMIKSLGEQLTALRGEGRGRKATIIIHDKGGSAAGASAGAGAGGQGQGDGSMAKGDEGAITADEFMLKAQTAYEQKLITGVNLTTIDVCLRGGQPIPAELISKVAKAKSA